MRTVKQSGGRHSWRHERTSTRLPKPSSVTGKTLLRYIPYKVWGTWMDDFVRRTVSVGNIGYSVVMCIMRLIAET